MRAALNRRLRLLGEVRAATSDLLTMLSNGSLTPPAIVRYPVKDFQEAVRLADGEAGQEKVALDFSERAPQPAEPHGGRREPSRSV